MTVADTKAEIARSGLPPELAAALTDLLDAAAADIEGAESVGDLDRVRDEYLGRRGHFATLTRAVFQPNPNPERTT